MREYRGGLADWVEASEPTESVTDTAPPDPDTAPPDLDPHATIPIGPPLAASQDGAVGRGPARLSRMRRLDKSVLDLVQQRSTLQLFLIWLAMILLTGLAYWLGALVGEHGLVEAGRPVDADLKRIRQARSTSAS